jgi:hypothetical protein
MARKTVKVPEVVEAPKVAPAGFHFSKEKLLWGAGILLVGVLVYLLYAVNSSHEMTCEVLGVDTVMNVVKMNCSR